MNDSIGSNNPSSKRIPINVMAPLIVRDWQEFRSQMAAAKAIGVHGVSTDVWFGIIEPVEGKFDWAYYDAVSDAIIEAGLRWVPIISLHQCGGNIGDTESVPVPSWVWNKLKGMVPSGNVEAVKYVSEQGHACNEYVSAWATNLVLPDYMNVLKAFQEHFANKAQHIAEINISLGPAGELRYPSYNSHDIGTDWPNVGALQCYSELAKASFESYVLKKYGSKKAISKAWGEKVGTGGRKIEPPCDVPSFYANREHLDTQYGRDFFDWYSDSLIAHGRMVMHAALDVFAADDSAFKGIDIGAKMSGIHWRIGSCNGDDQIVLSDRLGELPAGLIRTSAGDWNSIADGRGYRPLISLFAELQSYRPGTRVVLHFTCLEMADAEVGGATCSLARQLVWWIGKEAHHQGVPIKGENALAWNLPRADCWDFLRSVLATPGSNGAYEGLTLLRLGDCLITSFTRKQLLQTCRCDTPDSKKAPGQVRTASPVGVTISTAVAVRNFKAGFARNKKSKKTGKTSI